MKDFRGRGSEKSTHHVAGHGLCIAATPRERRGVKEEGGGAQGQGENALLVQVRSGLAQLRGNEL